MEHFELFVAGAGAAGIQAAISAAGTGCGSILIADGADTVGGILPQCIHSGFGLGRFGIELTGPEFLARLTADFPENGIELALNTEIVSVTSDRQALLSSPYGVRQISFDRMILATGSREITAGELNISGSRPSGIFTAGQAQGLINLHHRDIGKEIIILGSGDLGMIMARRCTLEGGHVISVIEKNASYGGMARNYHRCIEAYGIPVMYSTVITRIHGEGRICGVTTAGVSDEAEHYIPCDTLIIAAGLVPERSLIQGLENEPWLALCGNCSRIHDIVDSAVAEADIVGKRIFTI